MSESTIITIVSIAVIVGLWLAILSAILKDVCDAVDKLEKRASLLHAQGMRHADMCSDLVRDEMHALRVGDLRPAAEHAQRLVDGAEHTIANRTARKLSQLELEERIRHGDNDE